MEKESSHEEVKESIPVYELSFPEYNVDKEPNHQEIGAKVDKFIKQHFLNQYVAIRCLGSSQHPGKSIDELVEIIKTIGHDRYDPDRKGDRYENNTDKKIDIFALDFEVKENSEIFSHFTWPFYHWSLKINNEPTRIDIVILYDPNKLNQVYFTYAGRENEGERSDGFTFKDPINKADAIKGIIKITN